MDLTKYTTEELKEIIKNFTKVQREIFLREKQEKPLIVGRVYKNDESEELHLYLVTKKKKGSYITKSLIIDKDQICTYDTDIENADNLIETNISQQTFKEMWDLTEIYNEEVASLHDKLYNNLINKVNCTHLKEGALAKGE